MPNIQLATLINFVEFRRSTQAFKANEKKIAQKVKYS